MELISIDHYVEKSFEGKPSFVLLMSDGKQYISNGCVFEEMTDRQIKRLTRVYKCDEEMQKLLDSPHIELHNVVNTSYMFSGCTSLTVFKGNLSKAIRTEYMFSGCTSLTSFKEDLNKVKDTSGMFYKCSSLISFEGDFSEAIYTNCMFYRCTSLTRFKGDFSKAEYALIMFEGCTSLLEPPLNGS